MSLDSSKYLRRPFPGIHWIFLVLLLALWALSLYSLGSEENSRYLVPILATLTICIAFWSNHVHVGHICNFGNLVNVVTGALSDLFVLFVLLMIIDIATPNIDGNSFKANAYKLFSISDPIRAEIGKRFAQQQTLNAVGSGLHVEFTGRGHVTGTVTNDGVIIISSDEPAAALILQPVISNKELSWKCLEFPKKYACKFVGTLGN